MIDWYYRDAQSRKIGPLSTDEFEERVSEGEIQGKTRVWRSDLSNWTTYEALLARETRGPALATGPAASAAPHSHSQCSSTGCSASAANHPSSASVTHATTSHPAAAPAFELCPGCREEMPSSLFQKVGDRRICGNWLGKYLVRLALIAAAILALRILLMEMGAPTMTRALPASEGLSISSTAR